jgi:hypothetical protein
MQHWIANFERIKWLEESHPPSEPSCHCVMWIGATIVSQPTTGTTHSPGAFGQCNNMNLNSKGHKMSQVTEGLSPNCYMHVHLHFDIWWDDSTHPIGFLLRLLQSQAASSFFATCHGFHFCHGFPANLQQQAQWGNHPRINLRSVRATLLCIFTMSQQLPWICFEFFWNSSTWPARQLGLDQDAPAWTPAVRCQCPLLISHDHSEHQLPSGSQTWHLKILYGLWTGKSWKILNRRFSREPCLITKGYLFAFDQKRIPLYGIRGFKSSSYLFPGHCPQVALDKIPFSLK